MAMNAILFWSKCSSFFGLFHNFPSYIFAGIIAVDWEQDYSAHSFGHNWKLKEFTWVYSLLLLYNHEMSLLSLKRMKGCLSNMKFFHWPSARRICKEEDECVYWLDLYLKLYMSISTLEESGVHLYWCWDEDHRDHLKLSEQLVLTL